VNSISMINPGYVQVNRLKSSGSVPGTPSLKLSQKYADLLQSFLAGRQTRLEEKKELSRDPEDFQEVTQ
ncbi:MAG: hypothetical protein ACLFTO_01580, partial [Candidatus Acetothermia bacterium]